MRASVCAGVSCGYRGRLVALTCAGGRGGVGDDGCGGDGDCDDCGCGGDDGGVTVTVVVAVIAVILRVFVIVMTTIVVVITIVVVTMTERW